MRRLNDTVGRDDEHVLADPFDEFPVGDDVRATGVERLAAHGVARGGAREQLDHVALVDRRGPVERPTPAR